MILVVASERKAYEKFRLSEIRAQWGIMDAEIPICPVREPDFGRHPKQAKSPFRATSDYKTSRLLVSQLGDIHPINVHYAVERAAKVEERTEVLASKFVLEQHR